MRAAKVQASLRIRAVSPEPPLLAHTSSETSGTLRRKARSLAPLNGWACAVKICHDGMLEDTNSLDAPQILIISQTFSTLIFFVHMSINVYAKCRGDSIYSFITLRHVVYQETCTVKLMESGLNTLYPYLNFNCREYDDHRFSDR